MVLYSIFATSKISQISLRMDLTIDLTYFADLSVPWERAINIQIGQVLIERKGDQDIDEPCQC